MNHLTSHLIIRAAGTLLLLSGTAPAAIRTVTNLNDSGSGSLRATIAAASSGDTVNFAVTGTITLTSDELRIDKNLTITGTSSPSALKIERSAAAGTPSFRIFTVTTENRTVQLSGMTISNGSSRYGGGGLSGFRRDSITITNCIFRNNASTDYGGGAILCSKSQVTVQNCVFENNTATFPGLTNPPPDSGGAIQIYGVRDDFDDGFATLNVQSCTFINNSSQKTGGAIAAVIYSPNLGNGQGDVNATVENCTFTGNSAMESGGAIVAGGTLTVSNSTFSGNTSDSSGGGIYCAGGALTIDTCTFDNNTARSGGGVSNFAPNGATVRKSLFLGNAAQAGSGGAIYNTRSLALQNCTFSGNRAIPGSVPGSGTGGGIFHTNSTALSLLSCTFAGNSAGSGARSIHLTAGTLTLGNTILGDIAPTLVTEGPDITSSGYNLSRDGGATYLTGPGDQYNTDPQLDPLGPQNNGGPTKTIALLSTSPALDRGKAFGLTTDQRGRQRPVELSAHPNAAGGDGSDIGAFESTEPLASLLVVTTLQDHDDGVAGEVDCTLREAIARANALGSGGSITFLNGLQGQLALDRNLGTLSITASPVTLTGPGARVLAVSAGGYMRVFQLIGSSSSATVSGLTIRDGSSGGENAMAGVGGGVFNEGSLTCNDCAFEYHSVRGGSAIAVGGHGADGSGGGIYNARNLTLNRCTFTNCLSSGGYGMDDFTPPGVGIPLARGGNGGSARGGAIYHGGLSLTVNQCTFQGNNATGAPGANGGRYGGGGGHGQGGAIFCNQRPMLITGSTFAGNVSFGGAGGDGSTAAFDGFNGTGSGGVTAEAGGGTATLRSTLIAGNTRNGGFPADVAGAFTSEGYNLIGSADAATGLTHATDQKGTNAAPLNPMVGPVQNNGGHTNTMAPLAGSPLIDKGKSFGLTLDQRGLPRPLDAPSIPNASGGDGSDIGSVETDGPQSGPDFVVNSLDDHDDGIASYVDCTLREALNAAFFAAGADTVMFQPGLTGTITLNSALGSLTMYDSMTLIGPGARRLTVQRESGVNGRILLVQGGPHYLSGLTLTGGTLTGNTGGQSVQGAGILTQGVLTVSDCTIIQNIATGGDNNVSPGQPGGSAIGGGVANLGGGTLTLNRCSLALNSVYGGRGFQDASSSGRGGDASGGAVFNDTGCTLTIVNCTFNDNSASGGNSGNANSFAGLQGGAAQGVICNRGTMTMTAATLRGGFGAGGASGFTIPRGVGVGGILAVAGSTNLVRNTLCAANTGNFVPSDIGGAFTSGGFNLIGNGDTGTGFTAAGDQKGTASAPINARFGVFFNYGGPTDTVGLLPDSPALDRGRNFGVETDQRGVARTYDDPALSNVAGGDGTDIGAFETRPAYSGPPVFVSTNMAGPAMQFQVQGQPGVSYQLQSNSSLTGSFTNAGAAKMSDGLGLVDFTDSGPLQTRRFYKAVQSP